MAQHILNSMLKWVRRNRGSASSSSRDQATAETRELAEAALRTAEAVKQELEHDRRVLAKLIEDTRPKRATPIRFLVLILVTAICALIVTLSAIPIPAAFSSPPPNYADPGAVGLFVWANSLNAAQAGTLQNPGISLSAVADQRSSELEYVATFPKKLIGDRFVIGITGSAVLSDFKSDGADGSNEYPECEAEEQGNETHPLRCQLITGIIPSKSSERAFGCRSKDDEDRVSIRFTGNARITSSFDWAHHLTSLPYLGNVRGFGTGSVEDIVEGTFGQNFPPASLTTCYYLGLNPHWTEHTPDFAPTSHVGDNMIWDPASNMADYVVVSTERSAQWKGTVLVAMLGVFGPAFLSLLVMTFNTGYSLRSQSRQRRN